MRSLRSRKDRGKPVSDTPSARVGATLTLTKQLCDADLALFSLVMGELDVSQEHTIPSAPVPRQIVPLAVLSALLTAVSARHAVRPGMARITWQQVQFHEPAYTEETLVATARVSEHDEARAILRIAASCATEDGRVLAEGEVLLDER